MRIRVGWGRKRTFEWVGALNFILLSLQGSEPSVRGRGDEWRSGGVDEWMKVASCREWFFRGQGLYVRGTGGTDSRDPSGNRHTYIHST